MRPTHALRLAATALLLTCAAPLAAQQAASPAPGAVLRGLDKVSGDFVDITLQNGETAAMGRLRITLSECRYPTDNPASDAFAYLGIIDTTVSDPIFEGWMLASSPALNALDHARYDVWVLRCTSS
ncbi:hypothetical protein CBW24_10065 [Pacificitalea manganoxidans]|uniref:DUF2155 domain-containing protein n=1 Tax=Pacificitalea manganoxidans TaxID=1411902 RepID=A0A291M062_9RHOB|nr:DUF2155 domain-containing protein [Pacificitalea manganoxidans]MAQ44882.1 DUF2155 domain-containing protein [Actibacterium sp.]OWU71966.1 hypothetical protein ATO2_01245 [Roseovarius sp. 22II1-1F6A]ATI42322.1 hypothetical protein CBW24_10065 [Pacificitalea manganoxidans]MBF53647.1 DUF2155 domain-containing protein [Actibacterium sp.]MDR6307848.1 hypothetical protein [Pacificitalea manganoxidans]